MDSYFYPEYFIIVTILIIYKNITLQFYFSNTIIFKIKNENQLTGKLYQGNG